MRSLRAMSLAAVVVVLAMLNLGTGYAADGMIVDTPELVVLRSGDIETCSMPAEDYSDLEITATGATCRLTGYELPAGSKRLRGKGLRRVTWEPRDGGTYVEIEFDRAPSYHVINAVPGTETRPQTPQVIIGFGFAPVAVAETPTYPVMGSRKPGSVSTGDAHGTFELPDMPPAKYSDALVTLNVRNVDFRDVLWYMSEVGNISIVLDPYWQDEPTGNRRPVGGGGLTGGGGGGNGGGGGGFRPAGDFVPTFPRSGTGRLTMNLDNVPFDLALELILISVGLVKVDIYPGSFD